MNKNKLWIRIDNRLVHGQVIENWLPYANVKKIVVVNDELANDEVQQTIINLAIPQGIHLIFTFVENVLSTLNKYCSEKGSGNIFLLFASCRDAKKAFELGLSFNHLNIGNIHYDTGKCQVCEHIALSEEDKQCLRFFEENGIDLDFRCIPNQPINIKKIW